MISINKAILDYGSQIARDIEAKALLLYADAATDLGICSETRPGFDIVLVTKNDQIPEKLCGQCRTLTVPNVNLTRVGQIKIAITKGIATGLFQKGDKIVCLSGIPKFGYVDSIFVIDVGREFEILTSGHFSDITEDVHAEVFGAVLNLALELAAQGREGRKVGTTFILGDHEKVLQLSRQMIINPFMGYPEEERNILSPDLKETIKEFSAIDGAFVIKDDGTLITAGRHLSAALDSKDFPQGLGSRHIAAAGITSVTRATAIVLSESSGNVSVFKDGKFFVTIEKPTE
ncbi:MAG: Diadenylate cyclase [Syntrophus sp. SKADARSKE-3]|nr:Diadenylate cyclase [Syntrophus sp. SKADARSKE-3]